MPIEQILVLAIIQGITEFLPISSSGHLILVPIFTGWADQGLIVDVMVHMGSLLAILVYFWRDVLQLGRGGIALLTGQVTAEGRLLMLIAAATVPAVLFGLFLRKSGFLDSIRGPQIVAWNAIVFGLLMLAADWLGGMSKRMENMTLTPALTIGIAQALALIPGTSRSGVTITAARATGVQPARGCEVLVPARHSGDGRGGSAGARRSGASGRALLAGCAVDRGPDVPVRARSDRLPHGGDQTVQPIALRHLPHGAGRGAAFADQRRSDLCVASTSARRRSASVNWPARR